MRYTHILLSSLVVLFSIACTASNDDGATSNNDAIKTPPSEKAPPKLSGYDFDGPKALLDRPDDEVCLDDLTAVDGACKRVNGQSMLAHDCVHMCSLPVAERGQQAGYDFGGFKKLPNDRADTEICLEFISEEQAACDRVDGITSGVNGCGHLCSKPIAPSGNAAGFNEYGFKIVANDKVSTETCPAVISETRAACEKVGGTTSRINGCADLCSLPF